MRGAIAGRQGGVALAVVVWFIAGMSILVAGIVTRTTVDARLAQAHLARAQAEAAGDGAIVLLLAELVEGQGTGAEEAPSGSYSVGDFTVRVLAVPTAALVDLNAASQPVLTQLFRDYGAMSAVEATALAASVVEWRRSGGQRPPRSSRFEVVEDLLQVEGMTRTRLDDIRHLVAAGQGGSSRRAPSMDWVAERSPSAMIAGGSSGANTRRDAGRGSTSYYRADAIVEAGGRFWLRRRWIELGGRSGSSLPWSTRRVEPARVVGGAP